MILLLQSSHIVLTDVLLEAIKHDLALMLCMCPSLCLEHSSSRHWLGSLPSLPSDLCSGSPLSGKTLLLSNNQHSAPHILIPFPVLILTIETTFIWHVIWFVYCSSPQWKVNTMKERDFCLFCSLLYSQHLWQYLEYSRNICRIEI